MPATSTNDSVNALSSALKIIFDAAHASSTNTYAVLQPEGMKLFAGLSVIALAWAGIKIILEEGVIAGVAGNLIRTILLIGIVFWFISPDGYQIVFIDGIAGSLTEISNKINPGMGGPDGITNAVFLMIQHMVQIGNVISSWFSDVGGILAPAQIVAILVANIIPFLYLVASMIALFVAALVYFITGMISMVMITIAISLGPIMIPWLLFRPAAFLFDGWVRLLITASLYQVVGAIILNIGSATMTSVTDKLSAMSAYIGAGDDKLGEATMLAISLAMVSTALAYLTKQIPTIAQGLVSGSGNVSISQFLASAGKAGSGGVSNIGVGTGKLVSGAGSVASRGATSAGGFMQKGALGMALGGSKAGASALSRAGSAMKSAGSALGNAAQNAGGRLENYSKTGDLKHFVGKGRTPSGK